MCNQIRLKKYKAATAKHSMHIFYKYEVQNVDSQKKKLLCCQNMSSGVYFQWQSG